MACAILLSLYYLWNDKKHQYLIKKTLQNDIKYTNL